MKVKASEVKRPAGNNQQVELLRSINEKLSGSGDNTDIIEALKSLKAVIDKKDVVVKNEITERAAPDYSEIARYIGEKIVGMTNAIKDRPESFEFDLKRSSQGNLYKVIVKPLREN